MSRLRTLIVFSALCSSGFAAETGSFFPYTRGWLGGDSAYSIPLDSASTLWLFGDTFVGKSSAADRRQSSMIHNSVALRKCRNGECTINYWWSGMRTPHPQSFFKTPESGYYWPLDGCVYKDRLYLFWEQMHKVGDGGAFGFDYSSVLLATISNYLASPDKWQVSYRTVATGNQVIPGIATALFQDYLYVFTLFRPPAENPVPKKPFLGLLRLPCSHLALKGKSTRWEYLANKSEWHTWNPHSFPPDALQMIQGNITEASVVFHPSLQTWVASYTNPVFPSSLASYSTAKTLDGPWTQSSPLFTYPEMQPSDPRYTRKVFCYAAKEHPELESKGNLAFTYACNSTSEAEILRDMRLYRPELVTRPATAVGMPGAK